MIVWKRKISISGGKSLFRVCMSACNYRHGIKEPDRPEYMKALCPVRREQSSNVVMISWRKFGRCIYVLTSTWLTCLVFSICVRSLWLAFTTWNMLWESVVWCVVRVCVSWRSLVSSAASFLKHHGWNGSGSIKQGWINVNFPTHQ